MLNRVKHFAIGVGCSAILGGLSPLAANAQTGNNMTYTGSAPDMSTITTALITAIQNYVVYNASGAYVILALCIAIGFGFRIFRKASKSS